LASNPVAYKSTGDKNAVVDALFGTLENDTPWDTPLPKSRETNLLLVLRTIANMFQTASGPVPALWTSNLFTELQRVPATVWTKGHLLALATLLLNYSCVIHRSSNASQDQEKHLALVEMVLGNTNTDQESLYRALVAFGNVVSSSAKPKLGKATATWLRLSSSTSKRSGEKRTRDLVDEVQSLIL